MARRVSAVVTGSRHLASVGPMRPLLALALVAPCWAQEPLVPAELRAPLGDLIEDLAEVGRVDDVVALTALMLEAGEPAAALSSRRLRWLELAQRKQGARLSRGHATKLADLASELGQAWSTRLEALEGADRQRLAQAILDLDEDNPAAREARGDVQRAGGWWTAEDVRAEALAERAARARAQAEEVPVSLEVGPSSDAILQEHCAGEAIELRGDGLLVHTDLPADQAKAAVTRVVRAFHYSGYLARGRLTPVRARTRVEVIWLANPGEFAALGRRLSGEGLMNEASLSWIDDGVEHLQDTRGVQVGGWRSTPSFQSSLLHFLWVKDLGTNVQPPLVAGHLCGVSLDFWGYPCPPIFASYAGRGGDGRTASGGAGDGEGRRPDDASWRVTSTSLVESREYLEGLAREDRDPAWIESIEPPSGLIRDLDMLKSLWVVQYLQERGRFRELLESTRRGRRGRAVFVEALGGPLEELEAEWRRWLLDEPAGLVQRLRS